MYITLTKILFLNLGIPYFYPRAHSSECAVLDSEDEEFFFSDVFEDCDNNDISYEDYIKQMGELNNKAGSVVSPNKNPFLSNCVCDILDFPIYVSQIVFCCILRLRICFQNTAICKETLKFTHSKKMPFRIRGERDSWGSVYVGTIDIEICFNEI